MMTSPTCGVSKDTWRRETGGTGGGRACVV